MSEQLPLFDDVHDDPSPRLPGSRRRLALMVGLAAVAVAVAVVRPVASDADEASAAVPQSSSVPESSIPASSVPESSIPASSVAPVAGEEADEGAGLDTTLVVVGDGDGTGAAVVVDAGTESTPGGDSSGDGLPVLSDDATDSCAPPMDDATREPTDDGDAVLSSGFDEQSGDAGWLPLAGTWEVVDGRYVQSDDAGFDLITELAQELPDEVTISLEMEAISGPLGGGVVLGQPLPGSRRGAHVVDVTAGGTFLRFGRYDDATGQYGYLGGVELPADFADAGSHRLVVEVLAERTVVTLDDTVAVFPAVGRGRIGLVTSESAVAFDDLLVTERS